MSIGPFELIERLGQGAQGEVWKAHHRSGGGTPEVVALKVLNPDLIRSPNRLAQFRHEAERGTRLTGPSLLRVTEFGQVDRFFYMAMPLIEGTTLQQIIRNRRYRLQGRPVELTHRLIYLDEGRYLRDALRIMGRAAHALGRIHASRVVHRDIKPANILLDARRGLDVYLCDLGLGRDLEFATPQQMRDGAGTPMYMAPERLLKAPADEMLCDLYSLGVTLFESVTLDRPFQPPDGLPVGCLSVYLASSLPRRPGILKPGIPAELEAVILKAMARAPEHRYRSADELASTLDRLAHRLDPSAPPPVGNASGSQTHGPRVGRLLLRPAYPAR
ncbi:MAG: serine/threonine-protein kinase [Isosphaeraceae bacterium]